MSKINFKVSARTAKLIGQENFSNPEGATIELVKNSYDADAKDCYVIFDIKIAEIPQVISKSDFNLHVGNCKEVKLAYSLKEGEFLLKPNLKDELLYALRLYFFKDNSIYIIDNGEGMDSNVIQNQWMEIGTGNKELNFKSDDGRLKTGAKGIGRFALDRLGHTAEMWTSPKKKTGSNSYYWKMDWRQFENPHKSMTEIQAELLESDSKIWDILNQEFPKYERLKKLFYNKPSKCGTIIKISNLKDSWTESALTGVFKSLEALIPPKELAIPFSVNFFHLQQIKKFGEVETAYFNDFDYRLICDFDAENLKVNIKVTRNELDVTRVKKEYPNVFKGLSAPYDLKSIEKKTFSTTRSANEILKWEENTQNESTLKKLGNFTFSFYFLKNQTSQKEDYPYKDVNAKERREINEKFGGIKIYRDSFRVRPYGDPGNDWLKLGERASVSPAGPGQRIGDWKVRPNQIAGIINISRVENSSLTDKSDRGSLVENDTFLTLQNLIKAIIGVFELDRSRILNPFYIEARAREEKERKKEIQEEAVKLADKIVAERIKVEEKLYGKKPSLFQEQQEKQEKQSYRKIIEEGFEKIEKGDDDDAEIAQVRTLASLGLIVSSFAHELKEVRNNADAIDELEGIYTTIIPDQQKKLIEYKDGLNIIASIKTDNEKIAHWVDYSLTAIKKDKRKRSSLKFDKYFTTLKNEWKNVLANRNISMVVKEQVSKPYLFRAFEMDMNTIFSNLISNSIDSFQNLKVIRERKIALEYSLTKNSIRILYSDTGTGLPKVFQKDKDEIFLPFTTSKKDKLGNDIGTGLGMYLVKNVVVDNNGSVEIIDTTLGFKIKIEFPVKIKLK